MCEDKEHIIALFYDYDNTKMVNLKELEKEEKSTVYTMSMWLDRRYGTNLFRFNYCPICGKKIDWNKLKKEYGEKISN